MRHGKPAQRAGTWRRFVGWIASGLARPVPPTLRACEFDCRETDCSAERWSVCEHRFGRRGGLSAPLAGDLDVTRRSR